ncbi:MAG: dTMP kinase [Eubacteriales bacterium]|nr:dTMP kinase [Eubacteriales bacterium]
MKYKAVVFDLDGTITESGKGILHGVRYALEKLEIAEPDTETLKKFLGPPLAVSFRKFLNLTHEQALLGTNYYREKYNTEYFKESAVYQGIRSLLINLKREGAYIAIATGKPMGIAREVIKHFRLEHFFDEIIGPDENNYYDEKKEAIKAALNGEKDAVMIGDRYTDILGAQQYGIPVIAVKYGYGTEEEFRQYGADFIAEDVDSLYSLLGLEKKSLPGYFVSIEGNDGCGKSTQHKLLSQKLEEFGFDVLATREPGGTPLSEKIRGLILDTQNSSMFPITESYLFAAARAQHVREKIEPALKQGQLVVSDRFVDSSIAYQGGGQELGKDLVQKINAPAVDGNMPDTTIYLDLSYDEALNRRTSAGQADRIEQYNSLFHKRTQEAFIELLKENPDRIFRVDASKDKNTISEAVFDAVMDRLILKEKELCRL